MLRLEDLETATIKELVEKQEEVSGKKRIIVSLTIEEYYLLCKLLEDFALEQVDFLKFDFCNQIAEKQNEVEISEVKQ